MTIKNATLTSEKMRKKYTAHFL